MKVLLADDEAIILEGLKLLIDWNEAGFELVGTASNGAEALEMINTLKPEIVVSDIKMPEMTGLELLEKVREQKSDISFIFLTGYDSFDFARDALRFHALDYLLKPVRRDELLAALNRAKDIQLALLEKKRAAGKIETDLAAQSGSGADAEAGTGVKRRTLADLFRDFTPSDENARESYLWLHQGLAVDKSILDDLVHAVEIHSEEGIREGVERLNEAIREANERAVGMIVNYLLFELLHVAKKLNQEVDQEEVLKYTFETALPDILVETTDEEVVKVFLDYSEYLSELRRNDSDSILSRVEAEIRQNYKDNLTLKFFAEKYFINASYLGQLFRAKYGISFKAYVHKVRIEKAEELLLNTDMKIYTIAEEIGYKDTDYFINHFIAAVGCTPTKFRKRAAGNSDNSEENSDV